MPRVRSVLIVGGGSSGWMAASGLQHARPELDITLVESSDVPTVGVGEATLNSFHSFLLSVGLHEDEFLHTVGGALKLGIRYRGWSARDYWHPFGEVMFPRPFLDRWMADRAAGAGARFDVPVRRVRRARHLGPRGRVPRAEAARRSRVRHPLRAVRLPHGRGAVRRAAEAASTRRRRAPHRRPRRRRRARARRHRRRAHARARHAHRRPLRRLLGVPQPAARRRARRAVRVVLAVPAERLRGRVRAAARHREPAAAVHHRQRDAPRLVVEHPVVGARRHRLRVLVGVLRPRRGRAGDGRSSSAPRPSSPSPTTSPCAWARAGARGSATASRSGSPVGSSSRSSRPGLLTVEIGVDQLAQTLEGGDYDDALRDAFNDGFSQLYDNIRDFLVLHFRTAARRDTEYWRACTGDPLMVPARVADFIERWQHGEVPWTAPWPFAVGSWMYILDGNGVRPGVPAARRVGCRARVDARATQRRHERARLRATLPSTREFLARSARPLRSRRPRDRRRSRPPTTCGGRTTSAASGAPSTKPSSTARADRSTRRQVRVAQHTSVR